MKSFSYCVWLLIEKDHTWYNMTRGFTPHVTVKSDLTLDEARKLFHSIHHEPLNVSTTNLDMHSKEDFWGVFYNLKLNGRKPEWWPKGAHVSFLYQYNNSINEKDYEYLKVKTFMNDAKLTKLALVSCIGHYNGWEILETKDLI